MERAPSEWKRRDVAAESNVRSDPPDPVFVARDICDVGVGDPRMPASVTASISSSVAAWAIATQLSASASISAADSKLFLGL